MERLSLPSPFWRNAYSTRDFNESLAGTRSRMARKKKNLSPLNLDSDDESRGLHKTAASTRMSMRRSPLHIVAKTDLSEKALVLRKTQKKQMTELEVSPQPVVQT